MMFRQNYPAYNKCKMDDLHEVQKRIIYTPGDDPVSRPPPLERKQTGTAAIIGASSGGDPTHRQIGSYETGILFDSVAADSSSDLSSGVLNFSIPDFNYDAAIPNIIRIIVSDMYFPKIRIPGGSASPLFTYSDEYHLAITSLPLKSSFNGFKHSVFSHFVFVLKQETATSFLLTPLHDTLILETPITSLDTFSVQFKTPIALPIYNFKNIPLPPSTVFVTAIGGGATAQFTVNSSNTETLLAYIGVLTTQISVNFYSGSGPEIMTAYVLTTLPGFFVVEVIDTSTFRINAPVHVGAIIGQTVGMFIPDNRISMPIRFTSLTNSTNNYITTTS